MADIAAGRVVDLDTALTKRFYVEGNTIWTVDIGTHDIYRG